MADLKDILSTEENSISEQELMKYLEGSLSEEEKNAFEKKTANSSFHNDALEGLQQFKSKQQLSEYVHQLNNDLHQHLASRKLRKEKYRLKDNNWIILTAIIILLLCIISYFVIHLHNKNKAVKQATETGLSFKTSPQDI